jgi:hypothetical protein
VARLDRRVGHPFLVSDEVVPRAGVPEYLDEAPSGPAPAPPVTTTAQVLPFDQLLWEDFERLCVRLARLEGELVEHVSLYGTRGQRQDGIDLYARLAGGASYVTYQCKRYETFGAGDIGTAVDRFLSGAWAARSSRFVLCVSTPAVRTQLSDAVESATARLRAADPSVSFDLWDAEALSVSLKRQPELVLEFFGLPWLERFSPSAAPPVSPARPERQSWARALEVHRRREVRRGTSLELLGINTRLSHLPLSEADASIRVVVPESEPDSWPGGEHERELLRFLDNSLRARTALALEPLSLESGWREAPALALRPRGRVVLEGRPGGGKSTALRALSAHWAARPSWPVPVRAELAHLRSWQGGLINALIDVATKDVVGEERLALRAALAHEIANGRALLLLDGLDDVQQGRKAFVADLVAALAELPEAVEVVVTTRPSAAADAAPLALPTLTLQPPSNPEVTVGAILRALAPVADRETWIEDRSRWVTDVFVRDPQLSTTPLMVVFTTMIAAQGDGAEHLPSGRAEVLQRVLTDMLDNWEVDRRRRGDVTAGPLRDRRARQALMIGWQVLSSLVMTRERNERSEATATLRDAIAADFDLRAGDAGAAAEDAIAFWIDAGLFTFSGSDLTAAVRQLAELGSILPITTATPAVQVAWVDDVRGSRDLWASLALAAEISPAIGRRWAKTVAADGDAQELNALADGIRDGISLELELLIALADAAARLLPATADAGPIVQALTWLPLPPDTARQLRPAILVVTPEEHRAALEVLLIIAWDDHSPEAAEVLLAFVTTTARHGAKELVRDAFDAALIRLAAMAQPDAQIVLEYAHHVPTDVRIALVAALRQSGHDEIADQVDLDPLRLEAALALASQGPAFEFERVASPILRSLAGIAEPTPLSQLQTRHLNELCDFAATARLRGQWQDRASGRVLDAEPWMRAVAELGGFDIGTLVAQARLVLDDLDAGEETIAILTHNGSSRPATSWERVADAQGTLTALVGCLSAVAPEAVLRLMVAIETAPDAQQVVALLDRRLGTVEPSARTTTAKLLLRAAARVPQTGAARADAHARRLLADPDPLVRRAAAAWWGFQVAGPYGDAACLERCLGDSESGVRIEAIEQLQRHPIPDELRERLLQLRKEAEPPWVCVRCGHVTPGGRPLYFECENCGLARLMVAMAVNETLFGDDLLAGKLRIPDWE